MAFLRKSLGKKKGTDVVDGTSNKNTPDTASAISEAKVVNRKIKVRALISFSGPMGVFQKGTVYEHPEQEAKAWVSKHFMELVSVAGGLDA